MGVRLLRIHKGGDVIGIEFQGRFGNQLFQYAAARIAAERLGCGLVVHQRRVGRRRLLSLLGTNRVAAEIGDKFPLVTQSRGGIVLQTMRETMPAPAYQRLKDRLFPKKFEPRCVVVCGVPGVEIFDRDFESVTRGTWLSGYFQSSRYFSGYEADIQKWFSLSKSAEEEVDRLVRTFPAPRERMVAIHIRRTDYLTQRDCISHPTLGWALPLDYYRNALKALPSGLRHAVFSDDPQFAAGAFSSVDPWISVGSDPVTDLFLMSRCRYMIIANSSLSWWAAWLNSDLEKVVIAPRYHVGWYVGIWYPSGSDVPSWNYITVSRPPIL